MIAGPAQIHAYHGHTGQDQGVPDETYGDPVLYSEQSTDGISPAWTSEFQDFQLAVSTQDASSQTVTSQALPGQTHPSSAHRSPAYTSQQQFVSLHPTFGLNRAYQPHAAGMELDDHGVLNGDILDNRAADAAQDDPDLGAIEFFLDGSHEEFHDNYDDLQM